MTARPPARLAPRVLVAVALAMIGPLLTVTPARADPYTDNVSSAMVTRLTVADGRGWLTLQTRIWGTSIAGFEVAIPAAGGSWSGPDDIEVPELGTRCLRGPGPDLRYRCGVTDFVWPENPIPHSLPQGSFEVTLPVTRTGNLAGLSGLVGRAWVDVYWAEGVWAFGQDTFPVLDASHWLSTAEVRRAAVTYADPSQLAGRVTLPVTLTVVPGERVTALDVPLARPGTWSLESTDAATHGVLCVVRRTTGGGQILQCTARTGSGLPAGRYPISARLRFTGVDPVAQPGLVALGVGGRPVELMDSFNFDPVY